MSKKPKKGGTESSTSSIDSPERAPVSADGARVAPTGNKSAARKSKTQNESATASSSAANAAKSKKDKAAGGSNADSLPEPKAAGKGQKRVAHAASSARKLKAAAREANVVDDPLTDGDADSARGSALGHGKSKSRSKGSKPNSATGSKRAPKANQRLAGERAEPESDELSFANSPFADSPHAASDEATGDLDVERESTSTGKRASKKPKAPKGAKERASKSDGGKDESAKRKDELAKRKKNTAQGVEQQASASGDPSGNPIKGDKRRAAKSDDSGAKTGKGKPSRGSRKSGTPDGASAVAVDNATDDGALDDSIENQPSGVLRPAAFEGTSEPDETLIEPAALPPEGEASGDDDESEEPGLFSAEAEQEEEHEVLPEEEENRRYLKGILEALLFSSDKPLSGRELARAARIDKKRTMQLLLELRKEYRHRGVNIAEISGGFVLRSNPTYGAYVQKALALRPVRLSRAQLETLAIIAYRQPITRPEIDDIRGVDSGQVLKGLADRDLIKMLGKKDEAGRPMLYGTTEAFLELFSLESLKGLPSLREFTELSDDSKEKFAQVTGEAMPAGETAEEGDDASSGDASETMPGEVDSNPVDRSSEEDSAADDMSIEDDDVRAASVYGVDASDGEGGEERTEDTEDERTEDTEDERTQDERTQDEDAYSGDAYSDEARDAGTLDDASEDLVEDDASEEPTEDDDASPF